MKEQQVQAIQHLNALLPYNQGSSACLAAWQMPGKYC